jgi:ribonuclease HII
LDGGRFDAELRRRAGDARLIGVDEAGRGPWAGPVVVAAVALPEVPSAELRAARDSKLMTPKSRERLFGVVLSQASAVSVAWAGPGEIDRTNILKATLAAMSRAATRVATRLGSGEVLVLVDGPRATPTALPQMTIVDGDAKSLSIAAASIVAKVVRDRWMERYERRFPGYEFSRHKGYGTKVHAASLERLGPCRGHRFSYAPVARRQAAAL